MEYIYLKQTVIYARSIKRIKYKGCRPKLSKIYLKGILPFSLVERQVWKKEKKLL